MTQNYLIPVCTKENEFWVVFLFSFICLNCLSFFLTLQIWSYLRNTK
nr:MAG TPA: hypothetical protein [Caudoviricetes sp.]